MSDTIKYLLEENKLPKTWYNIAADLPQPLAPPLHPGTHKPVGPDDLAPLFPMALIGQEVSQEREIEIPNPVREIYKQWRPSPLYRAKKLEKHLDTPAKIYYKYEKIEYYPSLILIYFSLTQTVFLLLHLIRFEILILLYQG